MTAKLRWGHVNINVADLDVSVEFYRLLGFEIMMPGIPYLGLEMNSPCAIAAGTAELLKVPAGTSGRACIMQLGDTFPKVDLTELHCPDSKSPLGNGDRGLARLCLGSTDLAQDVETLEQGGVSFVSKQIGRPDALADVAICKDPDGTLIELIQPHLERWPRA